jgi:hypothetical protein
VTDIPACSALLKLLVSGENITSKQLRAVLDDELWHSYKQDIDQARAERELAETGRLLFADYNRKLRVADMLYGRYNQLSSKRLPKTAQLKNRVDGLYESAVVTLQEILSRDRSAEVYIDGCYSDNPNESTISLEPEGMPRMRFHRNSISTRNELKLRVLTKAIAVADNCYGIGEYDQRSGSVLTSDTQAKRFYQKRVEAQEVATIEKNFHRHLPTFSKLFGK